MFKYVVLVALMVPAILAETTGITTCRNGAPQPARVSVEGCDSTPCSVYLNSNANMQLSFVAPFDFEEFRPSVEAGVLGFYINYPLDAELSVGCNFLEGGRCPISAGEDVVYNFQFPVADNYPQITVDIELILKDQNDDIINCAGITIAVKSN